MPALNKSVCKRCSRTVIRTVVDGSEVVLDSELISVVIFRRSGDQIVASAGSSLARRLHSELCEKYANDREKEGRRAEMRAFRKKRAL